MLKIIVGAVALTIATLPASAQTTAPGASGQMTAPSSPNSGAGIAGHPGNKNGPPAKSSSETTGGTASPGADAKTTQDASKVPGAPGGKSGPATKSPSSSSTK